jgi:hypothetical protein
MLQQNTEKACLLHLLASSGTNRTAVSFLLAWELLALQVVLRAQAPVVLAYKGSPLLLHARSTLMAAHCTAGLRHDAVGQETLLNLLLRNCLAYNLYDQVRGTAAATMTRWRSHGTSTQASRHAAAQAQSLPTVLAQQCALLPQRFARQL